MKSKMTILCLLLVGLMASAPIHSKEKRYWTAVGSEQEQFLWFRVPKTGWCTTTDILKRNFEISEDAFKPYFKGDYSDYFKFAFVRNPWDRVVSCYFNKVVPKKYPYFQECWDKDFDYFVNFIDRQDLQRADHHIILQTALIPMDEIDFIGRFENFSEDLTHVLLLLGASDLDFDHRNQSEHEHYSVYYTEKTKRIIARKYKLDIDNFGYRFETISTEN